MGGGLHPGHICDKMSRAGIRISRYIASELPEFCGFRKQRYAKTLCSGRHDDREARFQKIARFRDASVAEGPPVLSTDAGKKEHPGNSDRGGHCYGRDRRSVGDHDSASASVGIVIPHGICDVVRNHGYITPGTGRDTSESVCDNLPRYRQQELQRQYPPADAMLLLCDGGGSDNCRHHPVRWVGFAQIGSADRLSRSASICPWLTIRHIVPNGIRSDTGSSVIFNGHGTARSFIQLTLSENRLSQHQPAQG
ncbi:MAG: hypothetical protein HC887_11705 [Desulfobacteraceae bacterium]|nr:hypothetical protein [Desulfobacteraceae bacterium]